MTFTCQLYELRRTKTRQSNYKIQQICETTKQPVKFAYQLVNLNKKANSKMHALGRSVAIVYECGCVLAAHVSIMYTLQICLIRTNLKDLHVFLYVILQQYLTKAVPSTDRFLTPQRPGQNFLKLHKCGTNFFQTSKNDYIYKEHFQKMSGSQLYYHVICDLILTTRSNKKCYFMVNFL